MKARLFSNVYESGSRSISNFQNLQEKSVDILEFWKVNYEF